MARRLQSGRACAERDNNTVGYQPGDNNPEVIQVSPFLPFGVVFPRAMSFTLLADTPHIHGLGDQNLNH
jgi:hypothetical protein